MFDTREIGVVRTKVIARHNDSSRLLILGAAGAALITLNLVTQRWTDYTRPAGPGVGASAIHLGSAAAFFLVIPCLLVILSWSEQRWWYAALETLAIWAGAMGASLAWPLLAPASAPRLMDVLSPVLALLPIYLTIRFLALVIVRRCVVCLLEQDGTLCTSCAYNLTGNLSGICPECGTRVADHGHALPGSE